ncbi:MAG: neuraminidase-like domain-containing protein [Candidatus Methanofastidiosia archaeon]
MNPRNQNLSMRMKGKDVEHLQESLRLLDFAIEDKEGYFGKTTHQAVLEFQKTHGLEPTGVVDNHTATKINEAIDVLPSRPNIDLKKRYIVQGNLLQSDGSPVDNAVVKAFDKELRQEKLLGEDKTNKEGKYTIYYTILQLNNPNRGFADLIMRAYSQNGKEIATSPLIPHASPRQTVDLIVGNEPYIGPSEYTRIRMKLEPLLHDVKPVELTEEDIAYLVTKTELNPILISHFVQSAHFAQESGIPADVFYGLFRQNLPTNLPVLLAQDPKVLRRALEASMRDNIISSKFQKSIDGILKNLREHLIEYALKKSEQKGKSSFSDLLDTAELPENKQKIFLQAYLTHNGSSKDFWQGLRHDPEFGDECVEALQTTMELAALTQNHLPLIEVLQKKQHTGEISSLRDLARYDQDDWGALIESAGLPESVPGANREEKIKNYARTMMQTIEDAFPTAVIAHSMDDDFPNAKDLKLFFERNRDFEFRSTWIDRYLKEHEGALDDIENVEAVKEQLRRMQRLFNITPRYSKYDSIRRLATDGLTSALTIRRMGKSAFMNQYTQQFGSQQTQQIYASAGQTAAEALMLFAEYGAAMNNIDFYVLPTSKAPEWEQLFGSLTLCECEHCRSVYSPAAYLVDFLHFLKNCTRGNRAALQVLFDRRGDIGGIELTCKNTNTVMPYVDLVNEILENAVESISTAYQTEGTAEELRVYPEHLNPDAYEDLKKAVYPWLLPFDLWAEEARVYLAHLGIRRYELMKRFSKDDASIDIVSEHLGLIPRDREIIEGATSIALCEFWGVCQGGLGQLETVSTFLKKSGLCYEELQELLHVQVINPNGEIRIEFSEPTCNPDEATIVNAENALDRIHRFVRLQQKLGLSIRELDAALRALPPHDLTEEFLINLSHMQHLHDMLKVPLITILSWWGNIDTISYDDEPSLFEKLFLDKTVTSPVDNSYELNATKDELTSTSHTIGLHTPAILAGLHISADDLALLVEEELPNDMLNLANLSVLYREASLAEALNLSVRDFLSLIHLSGIDPFDPENIGTATIRFVEAAELVRASGFTIEELNYLLCHVWYPNSAVAPSDEQISLFLSELRSGLQKIAQEYCFTSDPAGEKTAQALAILLSEDDAKEAFAIVNGTSKKEVEEQKNFIKGHFAAFLNTADAIKNLVGQDALEGKEERFNYVLEPLLAYLCSRTSETFVKQKIAVALSLTMEASELLLTKLVNSRIEPKIVNSRIEPEKAIADFLTKKFIESEEDPLTAKDFPTQFDQFRLLDKIATIVTRFSIPAQELTWLFVEDPGWGWFDLSMLPLSRKRSGVLFEAWSEIAKMANLRDALPSGEPTLIALLKMVHDCIKKENDNKDQEDEFRIALSKRTSWSIVNLEFLMGKQGFDLEFPSDYQNEKALEQLIRFKHCFDLVELLGVSAEQISKWSRSDIDLELARDIRQIVKAKYEEKQWLAVAGPLRDQLREQQRAALVAYVVHNMDELEIEDADDLLGYFLIDVEMSPCMMTSRIKQAISSVQLFVQRCLMNLEPDVTLTPGEAKQWEWMKNYRVWEANRKVFLYSGNWIEPELRDNKSPFFKDLENELLQNEVTMDTAEEAFKHYLEKLDEVKRLEISGIYYQVEMADQLDISNVYTSSLHVFGKTRDTPHIYYYRRWIRKTFWKDNKLIDEGHWSPWERVDVDIEGNHLVPVVYNRRLHLFWPVFREKVVEKIPTKENQPEKPEKYYEIQMAWSEYKDGKWLPKRISNEFIRTPSYTALLPKDCFRFYTFFTEEDNDLVISPECEVFQEDMTAQYIIPNLKQFKFIGCDKQVETGYYRIIRLDPDPIPGTRNQSMKSVELSNVSTFSLIGGMYADTGISILDKTPSTFSVYIPHQWRPYVFSSPFFYEDYRKTFFVVPESLYSECVYFARFRFEPFYHPYVCLLIRQLNRYGIDGLLNPDPDGEAPDLRRQMISAEFFGSEYKPTDKVVEPYPKDEFDFSPDGSYSLYNCELFFHAPFLIADHLSNNQRFAEAQKWYHYIFDPTDVSDDSYPARFWKIKPFYNAGKGEPIQKLMLLLNAKNLTEEEAKVRNQLVSQIDEWRKNPFNPHAIARIRQTAYQKAIVMKYLDNLISWGDHLFRQDTIESINEATQLYVLAAQILGKKPEDIPRLEDNGVKTFNDLADHLDEFSNALIEIETALSPPTREEYPGVFIDPFTYTKTTLQTSVMKGHLDIVSRVNDTELLRAPMEQDHIFDDDVPTSLIIGPTLFFCIPRNDRLLSYWDTVADRLFKIRYCMTIEGKVRYLPLFQSPIEPGLLVRAAAAGVDISSALNDLNAPLPHYRFHIMLQRAVDLCADVRNLGAALLSALEKRDAEELALLRSSHEVNLLKAVRQAKEQQIKEAEETLNALQKSKEAAVERKIYYESREYMNAKEKLHLGKLESARTKQAIAQVLEVGAALAALSPEVDIGVSGWAASPVAKARFGGINLSNAAQLGSQAMSILASIDTHEATKASIRGGFDRRMDDWKFQAGQAARDIEQIENQILAAEIRLAIAEQDLETHDLQTENAEEVNTFMRDKFTNNQLYNWMVSQLSTIYFQSYQMAYNLAKRAEKAFQHEIGDPDATFIKFGYWDSLKKGLLSGEKLHYDLKRMEVAYYDQNKREYEITKHVSLAMLHPEALVTLKEIGECYFRLPKAIFDLDYPGHYMRRIKSVSLTIPCVAGPYTNVSCTLTLLSNSISQAPSADSEVIYNVGGIQSIVTSSAREDGGLFELNFRDERYLPFEGAGVVSDWRIQLPTEFRQFDYDTISDVVIHIRYSARDGGETFKQEVEDSLKDALNEMILKAGRPGLFRLFSMKREFPSEWHHFLHPSTGEEHFMKMKLEKERFPFQFKDNTIQIKELAFFIKLKDGTNYNNTLTLSVTPPGGEEVTTDKFISNGDDLGGLPYAMWGGTKVLGVWDLKAKESDIENLPAELKVVESDGTIHLNPDAFEDMGILCFYSIA